MHACGNCKRRHLHDHDAQPRPVVRFQSTYPGRSWEHIVVCSMQEKPSNRIHRIHLYLAFARWQTLELGTADPIDHPPGVTLIHVGYCKCTISNKDRLISKRAAFLKSLIQEFQAFLSIL